MREQEKMERKKRRGEKRKSTRRRNEEEKWSISLLDFILLSLLGYFSPSCST